MKPKILPSDRGLKIIYIGEWKDDKMHGQGTLIEFRVERDFVHAEKYVGEFKDGIRHGQGTQTYKQRYLTIPQGIFKPSKSQTDVDMYVGEWEDGHWHGQGVYIKGNGNYYEGEWKNGELVKDTSGQLGRPSLFSIDLEGSVNLPCLNI